MLGNQSSDSAQHRRQKHPNLVMGSAVFAKGTTVEPQFPDQLNQDRFVLSYSVQEFSVLMEPIVSHLPCCQGWYPVVQESLAQSAPAIATPVSLHSVWTPHGLLGTVKSGERAMVTPGL